MDEWKARLLDALVGYLVAKGLDAAVKAVTASLREKAPETPGKHFKRP